MVVGLWELIVDQLGGGRSLRVRKIRTPFWFTHEIVLRIPIDTKFDTKRCVRGRKETKADRWKNP